MHTATRMRTTLLFNEGSGNAMPESDGSKVYLESTEEGALAWLEEYRSG